VKPGLRPPPAGLCCVPGVPVADSIQWNSLEVSFRCEEIPLSNLFSGRINNLSGRANDLVPVTRSLLLGKRFVLEPGDVV